VSAEGGDSATDDAITVRDFALGPPCQSRRTPRAPRSNESVGNVPRRRDYCFSGAVFLFVALIRTSRRSVAPSGDLALPLPPLSPRDVDTMPPIGRTVRRASSRPPARPFVRRTIADGARTQRGLSADFLMCVLFGCVQWCASLGDPLDR
jgi:hypothetical protein